MRQSLTALPTDSQNFDPNRAFNILIAYEDFAAGKQAKRTYDFLVQQLGAEGGCTNQMWKFSVLNIPKLRETAAQDAARADIVMLACSGEELPTCVKDWIDDWLPLARNTLALVALFNPEPPPGQFQATRQYLSEVARRGGLEFFAQPDVWPGRHAARISGVAGTEPSERTLASVAGIIEPDIGSPRWGINE